MAAMHSQTARRSAGEPSDLAIAAGVRKIPRAIDSPVTMAIAAGSPSSRFRGIWIPGNSVASQVGCLGSAGAKTYACRTEDFAHGLQTQAVTDFETVPKIHVE